jgi:hypothetical protein
MKRVDQVRFKLFNNLPEETGGQMIIVLVLDDVGLAAHGHESVGETMDRNSIVLVMIQALGIGDLHGIAGKRGEYFNLMPQARKLARDAEGHDFGPGGEIGKKLVDGQENSHLGFSQNL